jgi:flagellar protein FlgJ
MSLEAARVYTDFNGLAQLKTQARQDQSAAAGQVAKQFEALFVQMMVKSMRQASLGEGVLDSQQSLFYRDMYDQQLAIHLSERGGIGLAAAIERQITPALGKSPSADEADGPQDARQQSPGQAVSEYFDRAMPGVRIQRRAQEAEPATPSHPPVEDAATPAQAGVAAGETPWPDDRHGFVELLWPHAEKAAAELGLEPRALVAQAALETGWGERMIRRADGGNSYNLFGIKADGRWQGDTATVSTLEYEDGVAVRRRAAFRAYDSVAESIQDYVRFVRESPRYRRAIERAGDAAGYFRALQHGGYATDPDYARKIERVMRGKDMQAAVAAVNIGV